MTKRVVHELTYDAPAAQVFAMMTDPSFREEVCERLGVLRQQVTIEATDTTMEATIDQVQTAHDIPGFARKFVGDEINIVQRERWASPDAGDITVTIPGKPGEMSGTARLSESDGTTTEHVDMSVKVNIPLVGGKIEGLIADRLLQALKAENEAGRDYLSR